MYTLNTKNLSAAELTTKTASLEKFSKAANALMIDSIKSGVEVDFQELTTKALTIAGSDGESLAIDDVLGRSIIESAREKSTILSLVGMKNVTSKQYREMVLMTLPSTNSTTEQISGTDWDLTDTQTYSEVSANFAKQYAKPQISIEAMDDPELNLFAHLQSLVAEVMAEYWAKQVIAGTGTANTLRGILGAARLSESEGIKEQADRSLEHYPIMYSEVAGALGDVDPTNSGCLMDVVIDLTTKLPSKYLSGSYFLMNRRTLGEYRKLKDTLGRPLVQFEEGGFTLAGYPVKIEDLWPDITDGSYPVLFGNLSKAFALINYSEHYLLDPYSVDGAVQLKTTVYKGDIVQNNDAIILLRAGTSS